MLLRMISLDLLDKVAKRVDFFLDFLLSKKSSEKSSRLARALCDIYSCIVINMYSMNEFAI